MRLFLFSLFIGFCVSVSAQQKAKFKTANQAQKEDSVYQATRTDSIYVPPIKQSTSTRKVDTAAWGALGTVGLVFVVPDGDLATVTDKAFGYGFQAAALINPVRRRNPFAWERRWWNVYGGAGFGYIRQGGLKQIVTKNDTIAQRQFTSTTINSLWTFDLIGRVELLKGPIKLFGEFSWGGSSFKAEQQIEYTEHPSAPASTPVEINQTYGNNSEWVKHYAYGGGFRTGSELLKMEFKVMYHVGQSVQYIDPQTIKYSATENGLQYQTKKSATTMWFPQMAVSYLF